MRSLTKSLVSKQVNKLDKVKANQQKEDPV
jgi:hypothetical protein